MSRNAMEVADSFSHHMRAYDKSRAAEAAAQEMEGICMAAEDACVAVATAWLCGRVT